MILLFKIPKEERAHLQVSKETLCALRGSRKKMAIYHLTAKTVSRGSGSAKARSEYIDREAKYKHDQEEVLYKASGNMPEWANDSRKYWEAADTYERENGRLFKQLEFAIPKELKPEEQKALVKTYVDQLTTTNGEKLPYSYAIHKGHDKENPHCHLMISERPLDGHERTAETWFKRANNKEPEKGGAKKTTSLMPKEWLENARETWSLQANKALERAGHEERIDHRSLEAQGIDREPTKHRGPALNAMLVSGKLTQEEIEKDLSEPTDTKKKESELTEANRLKEIIAQGMASARQDFSGEKDRQVAEERARQEQERQRIAQEKQQRQLEEARRQIEKQQEQERQRQEREANRPKSRGMGMSR